MRYARVMYEGKVQNAGDRDGQLILDDASLVPHEAVTWLPPLSPTPQPRTIIALGLNYADHVKELAFKTPPTEPLIFLKGERPHDEDGPAGILNTLKAGDIHDVLAYLTSLQDTGAP